MTDTAQVQDSASFSLEYDGPALAEHEMDVRDLAPALLSASSLFQELNRVANPLAPPVSVNVRATAEGSFLIELRVIYEVAKAGLLTPDAIALGTLSGLVGGVAALINFLKKRHESPVVSEEPLAPGVIRVRFLDGTTMDVPAALLTASTLPAIQHDLSEMMKPLTKQGVASLVMSQEAAEIARVESSDVPAFRPTASDGRTLLKSVDREVFLTIRTLGFESGTWSFSDGASNFRARVLDEDFLSRVDAGEAFSKLDVLRCNIREAQYRAADGSLQATVEILEVLEHLPPAQAQFDLDG